MNNYKILIESAWSELSGDCLISVFTIETGDKQYKIRVDFWHKINCYHFTQVGGEQLDDAVAKEIRQNIVDKLAEVWQSMQKIEIGVKI